MTVPLSVRLVKSSASLLASSFTGAGTGAAELGGAGAALATGVALCDGSALGGAGGVAANTTGLAAGAACAAAPSLLLTMSAPKHTTMIAETTCQMCAALNRRVAGFIPARNLAKKA